MSRGSSCSLHSNSQSSLSSWSSRAGRGRAEPPSLSDRSRALGGAGAGAAFEDAGTSALGPELGSGPADPGGGKGHAF